MRADRQDALPAKAKSRFAAVMATMRLLPDQAKGILSPFGQKKNPQAVEVYGRGFFFAMAKRHAGKWGEQIDEMFCLFLIYIV